MESDQPGNTIFSSIKWNAVNQTVSQGLVFVASVVISRILAPEVFGLFAMVSVLTNCFSLVVGFAFNQAVVQNRTLTDKDLISLFWLNVLAGAFMSMLFFIAAPFIAAFYEQAELVTVLRAVCPVFIISAAIVVPSSLLVKEHDFKHLAIADIAAVACSYAGGILLALRGAGVWALCFQYLTFYFVKLGFNLYFCRWWPAFYLSKESWNKVARFSASLLPTQVLNYFTGNVDLVIAGKLYGKNELGLYGRAHSFIMFPLSNISILLATSFFSVFAALQDNRPLLIKRYTESIKLIVCAIGILMMGLAIIAPEFIHVVFGDQWTDMVPVLRVMCISGFLGGIININDSLLTSQGQTGLLLKVVTIEKIILVAGIAAGSFFGIMGLAWGKVGSSFLCVLIRLYVQRRVLHVSLLAWLGDFVKIGTAFLITAVCVFPLYYYLPEQMEWLRVIAICGACLIVFVFSLYILAEPLLNPVKHHLLTLFSHK